MTATSTAASSLPPVRTSCHVPLSLMTSISEETIALWLKLGALEKLEQAVLDGYGDQLCGKTSRIPQVNKFLKQVPLFQSKIREIHQAVSQGRIRDVQHLIDRKKLAFCRDHNGASPLHKAVIFGHQDVIEYLVRRYGGVIHIRDHQGRTALHYAAFLPDRGEIYQYLLALGADERAMDVYGRQPSFYLDGQNDSMLRQLRDGSTLNGIRKIKPRYYSQVTSGQPFTNSNKHTVSKSHIRELISDGNLSALEELVLQGQGDRLLGETSSIPKIQSFLNIVPMYMERIYDVHRAVMRDQLEHVVILLENRKLALARDQLGATPLHKAVWFGHYKIAHYISNQFTETLNALDMEGRTALHYAAALKDNKNMYGILAEAGANKAIYDNKGKMADYYTQYPEHLNLEEVIKRCHKVNANYLANTASRIKGKSPVRQTPPLSNGNLSSPRSEENNVSSKENSQSNDSGNENELISLLQKEPLPKRIDINSANIRRWVSSKDMEKLTKAVMEGYGEKVVRVHTNNESEDKEEIGSKITEMVERVNAIHTAVSSDDLTTLQNQLDEKDYALAKDHMGMTPLHKAVILRKSNIVGFLIEKFPETINAKNKNGLTALHYAAAMSRKDGQQLYKMLLQAGADPKIRDNHGRTPDYYKTHLITMPNKGMMKTRSVAGRAPESLNRFSRHGVLERMTTALQRGDVELLQDLVLEGHGKHLLGKTSWHEDVKNFLKELPSYLNNMQSFRESIQKDDLESVKEHLSKNEKLLRAKDEAGAFPIHLAATSESSSVLEHFAKNYPSHINVKDSMGRTALHIVSQKGNHTMHKTLKQAGADSKVLDQKGRTADFYLQANKSDRKLSNDKPSLNTSSDSILSNSSAEGPPKMSSRNARRKSSVNLGASKLEILKSEPLSESPETHQESEEKETESRESEDIEEKVTDNIGDSSDELENKFSEDEIRPVTQENEEEQNEIETEDEPNSTPADKEDEVITTDAEITESAEEHAANDDSEVQTQEESIDEVAPNDSKDDLADTQDTEEEEKPNEANHTEDIEDIKNDNDTEESESNRQSSETNDGTENADKEFNADIIEDADNENEEKTNEEKFEELEEKDLESKPTEEQEEINENEEEKENNAENEEEKENNAENEEEKENSAENDKSEDNNSEQENEPEIAEPDIAEENETKVEEEKPPENTDIENEENPEQETNQEPSAETHLETNLQNSEGKTVAEVGSGNPDNTETNEESQNDNTHDMENTTETKEGEESQTAADKNEIGNVEETHEQSPNEENEVSNTDEQKESASEEPDEKNESENNEIEEKADETENENTQENIKTDENEEVNTGEMDEKQDKEEMTENEIENETEVAEKDESQEDVIEPDVKEENTESKEEPESQVCSDSKLETNESANELADTTLEITDDNNENSSKSSGESSHQTKDHLDELIEHWIKEGDLLRLEHVVLAGQGDRLIERTSEDKQVQDFLDLVPIYMAKIRAVHEAVAKGQLREVRSVLTRKRFALSRDHVGASPLHLAVLHGHADVSTYIISHFPETMDGPDNEGRTPLHYAAALPDNGALYKLLKSAGADENIEDKAGHSPKYYMGHPGTLTIEQLLEPYARHE